MARFFTLGLIFWSSALLAAQPQQLIPGFGGTRDKPIKITSEELAIDQNARQALFSGKVRAQQGTMFITALRMSVNYAPSAQRARTGKKMSPKFLYASGDVVLTGEAKKGQLPPTAHARLAEYNIATKKLILVGAVVLKQNGQTLEGQSLTIDVVSGLSRLDSSQKGKAGRIRGIFRKQ